MAVSFPNWLENRMLKGVKGFNIDSYLIALEGWRRGLELTWYNNPEKVTNLKVIGFNPLGKTFSLESNEQKTSHYFYRSRGDKVSNEAVEIVHQKNKAKTYFGVANIPTPKGITFDRAAEESVIIEKVKFLNYPVVLKPVLGSLGKGVITNIYEEKELFDAIKYVEGKYEDYHQYIVEEQIDGEEYRVYVIGEDVAAATKRIPSNVIGDGVSSIEHLIDEKNKKRQTNPYLAKKLIELDETVVNYLKSQGLNSDYIPGSGEKIRLKGQANISAGGDPIDATDTISEEIKKVASAAVRSIPGLVHAGVDIISNDKEIKVIEVNGTADIAMHIFPLEGESQNIPEKLIDFYFPTTKNLTAGKSAIYFDYKEIRRLLRDNIIQEITLSDAPKGSIHTARYIISGKVQKVGYRIWIRKQAIERGFHGYTRNLRNGNVVVIVGGSSKFEIEEFKKVCSKGPVNAKVKKVKELEWNHPIKLGFEIRKSER